MICDFIYKSEIEGYNLYLEVAAEAHPLACR